MRAGDKPYASVLECCFIEGDPAANGTRIGHVNPIGRILVPRGWRVRHGRFVDEHVEIENNIVSEQLAGYLQGTLMQNAIDKIRNQITWPYNVSDVFNSLFFLRLVTAEIAANVCAIDFTAEKLVVEVAVLFELANVDQGFDNYKPMFFELPHLIL